MGSVDLVPLLITSKKKKSSGETLEAAENGIVFKQIELKPN